MLKSPINRAFSVIMQHYIFGGNLSPILTFFLYLFKFFEKTLPGQIIKTPR